jgi:hypothetical protein
VDWRGATFLFDSDRLDEENVFAASSRHTYIILREKGVAV